MRNLLARVGLGQEPRRRARDLARQGRFREALAVGRSAWTGDDPEFALDLRDWRHRAFFEPQPKPVGRPDWPPAYADGFPAAIDAIPEVAASDLDGEALGGALQHHGSLIVRGLLPRARAESYANVIDAVFAARQAAVAGDGADYAPFEPSHGRSMAPEREFIGGFAVLMVDAPRFMARWMGDIEASGVVRAVSSYLGERPVLSALKGTLYRLPRDPGSQWHQDGAFLGDGVRTVNLWVACSECGVDAPGLDIIPWRTPSIFETGTEGSYFHWSVGQGVVDRMLGDRQVATPRFAPGDAVLFDQLCLHRTSARAGMTRGRYAIETWMFAPSHYGDGIPLLI